MFPEQLIIIIYYYHSNRILCFELTHTQRCNHKNSPRVQWNTHHKSNDFSRGKGWVPRRSAQVVCKMLWEAFHSEGVSGRSPPWTGRAQRAFLGTAVYRISRWLTLDISNFPSWSQSNWCRQQLHNSSTTQNVQFWQLPGRCNSRHQEFQVWSGVLDRPNSLLLYRQGKCQVVLIQWPPASYSCSAIKNTVLAGSGLASCEGVVAPPQHHALNGIES